MSDTENRSNFCNVSCDTLKDLHRQQLDCLQAPRNVSGAVPGQGKPERGGAKPDASKRKILIFHEKTYYPCTRCFVGFRGLKDLDRHQIYCLADDDRAPRHGKPNRVPVKRKYQVIDSEMKYSCSMCDVFFRHRRDAYNHVAVCSLEAANIGDVNPTKHKQPLNQITAACAECHAVLQDFQPLSLHRHRCIVKDGHDDEDEDADEDESSGPSESDEDHDKAVKAPCVKNGECSRPGERDEDYDKAQWKWPMNCWKGSFYCCICSAPCPSLRAVCDHQLRCPKKRAKAADVDETSFRCQECNKKFVSVEGLSADKFHCSVCSLKIYFENLDAETESEASEEDDEDEDEDEDASEEEDEDDKIAPWWLNSGSRGGDNALLSAKAGVAFLNKMDGGKKYELVEPGPFSQRLISQGPIYHVNFKAKEQGCPDAQVETFFSQMRKRPVVVDCCVSLGPTHKLPPYKRADTRGCYYCRYNRVHHPVEKCEKMFTGTNAAEGVWLYGTKSRAHKFSP